MSRGRRAGGLNLSASEWEELEARRAGLAAHVPVTPVSTRTPAAIAHQVAGQARHGQLKRAAVEVLTREGCWVWSQPTGGAWRGEHFIPFGAPGMGDIVGSMPVPCHCLRVGTPSRACEHCEARGWIARPLVVEVKTGTGRLSPDQESFLEEARRRGWWVYVCRDTVDGLVAAVREVMGR